MGATDGLGIQQSVPDYIRYLYEEGLINKSTRDQWLERNYEDPEAYISQLISELNGPRISGEKES